MISKVYSVSTQIRKVFDYNDFYQGGNGKKASELYKQ